MITFANAKINIGLNVLNKRNDGFHNIETIIYPIPLYDVIEFVKSDKNEIITVGNYSKINGENILNKVLQLLNKDFNLPKLKIILLKNIPFQSGLGGASSDAVSLLKILNNNFNLNLNRNKLLYYAEQICSDCPFFVLNKPALVQGKGENIKELPPFLKGKYITIIKPCINQPTGKAFEKISKNNKNHINIDKINTAVKDWKKHFSNDFQQLFSENNEIQEIINFLNNKGAEYISLTGSGSAVYGIFTKKPLIFSYKNHFVWTSQI